MEETLTETVQAQHSVRGDEDPDAGERDNVDRG